MKLLDWQMMGLGHPAIDIWGIVYCCTDAQYRADHLETDLRDYYTILATYMEAEATYTEFRAELEERRLKAVVWDGKKVLE